MIMLKKHEKPPKPRDWTRFCEWGASTFGPDCDKKKVDGMRFCQEHLERILRAGERGK